MASSLRYDIEKRYISLSGPILPVTAENVISALRTLSKARRTAGIKFFIDSEGGDFYASLKAYEAIRKSSVPVTTIVLAEARSGAFLMSQAGSRRFGSGRAVFKFHHARRTYPKEITMTARDLMEEFRSLSVIDAQQLLIFSERARPIATVQKLFGVEAVIPARKALDLRLLDGILASRDIDAACVEMKKGSI